ncbi:MAG: hypothetical protein HYY20_11110 [Candidatus Tectomicrobia bacterium]|uniref:Uncharacterized protein n=1 Tax=Tectimicrobiota bacterium TaxID=2528274 RepID=A0A932G1M6_UNCTE|nr:hypothetical protein [Candidatus Tectomicrobia bacterium]
MLEKSQTVIQEERMSQKSPLTEAEVQSLLREVDQVLIAKGKAVRSLKSSEATPDDLRGPTGNFRAPMLRKGKTLLVGFHEEALKQFL